MQREFSVRVAVASHVARASPPDAGVRQKVDWALAEAMPPAERAHEPRLVARTIETLRAGARGGAPATRRSPPGDR
jgi:hypothetical protein